MMVTGKWEKCVAKAHVSGVMELFTSVNGKTASKKEKVNSHTLMDLKLMEYLRMTFLKAGD